MHQNEILIEDHLPDNFRSYVVDAIGKSLNAEVPHLPTKLLFTESGSELFKKFTESNNYHNSQLEKMILEKSSELDCIVRASNIIVELGAGSFERTLNLVNRVKSSAAYEFWAIDFSIEPALTTLKKLYNLNNKCTCKLLLADYELSILTRLVSSQIEKMSILWLGNSCVNVFPDTLEVILNRLKSQYNVDRTLSIGINLATPSNEQCDKLLYNDKEGYFSEFRKSSLKLLEKELEANIPWQNLSWKTYFREDINAYVSVFTSGRDWTIRIDNGTNFEFKTSQEIIVGYSHAYTLDTLNLVVKKSGWQIQKLTKDEMTGYAILILKPLYI